VSRIAPEQVAALTRAIHAQDCLRRILSELEQLHRIVFHDNEHADWALVRCSAEQILIAEILSRHGGNPDALHFALRALENGGKSWDVAIRDLAASIHSYYTTPLGILMRQELFEEQAVFITPDAREWTRRLRAAPAAKEHEAS
jgi:hypothetical protein